MADYGTDVEIRSGDAWRRLRETDCHYEENCADGGRGSSCGLCRSLTTADVDAPAELLADRLVDRSRRAVDGGARLREELIRFLKQACAARLVLQ